jgi:hypothetical protein
MTGEMYGGKGDGEEIFDAPTIDLKALIELVDGVETFSYEPVTDNGAGYREGDRIELWGEKVLLKIFLQPFEEEDPQWVLDGIKKQWRRKE